jgi:Raf kinase inhibitor-like YbhB/YbcL family protein
MFMSLTLRSSAFEAGKEIPSKYTCEGNDIAPQLSWSPAPDGTKSLAVVMDDPDAPRGTWVHWVIVDLPPTATSLPEGGSLPSGARAGTNSWNRTGYGGPCPPSGRHRYFFKLYALDTALGQLAKPTKEQLESAMQGHILAQAELMGTYQKKR